MASTKDLIEEYKKKRAKIKASGIIPQLALLMGPCLGGQAYHPIMQDFLIQCRKTGYMGIFGATIKAGGKLSSGMGCPPCSLYALKG